MTKVKLGEVCEINIGKTPSRATEEYWNGNRAWLSISDMKNKYLSTTKESITDLAVCDANMKLIPKGTVVMSFKLSLGKVGILSEAMYSNEAIANFKIINTNHLSSDYLYYALQGIKFDQLTDRAVMGNTLNKAKLQTLPIILHNKLKQDQIVERLNNITKLISLRQTQIEKLNELVKSRYYDELEVAA